MATLYTFPTGRPQQLSRPTEVQQIPEPLRDAVRDLIRIAEGSQRDFQALDGLIEWTAEAVERGDKLQ
jgi:hypothetical protein